MTARFPSTVQRCALAAALALSIAACGGGTDGTGGSTGPVGTASYSTGVMKVGSVIVNGVRYDDANATILLDDSTVARSALKDGMVVKVKGTINDDGVNGVAERVQIENELRGTVTDVTLGNPPTLTVNGVLVQTDDGTVLADGLAITVALLNQRVEVHGLRDAAGVLRATRIESAAGGVDEFRGPIGAKDATTLTVGGVIVTPAAGATYTPAGCSFAALGLGQVVEVHGSFTGTNAFSANRVECEDLGDDRNGVKPPANARNKLEGFVTGLASADGNLTGSFTLNGITVQFSAATQIRNGARADLANGVRVEVDGTINGTTMNPTREISFKQDRIILQGAVTDLAGSSFKVLGQTVTVNDLTDDDGIAVADGLRVEIRARLLVDGTLIADEVRAAGGGGGGTRELVQARVTAKTDTTITVLGVVYTFAVDAEFSDSRDPLEPALTREQFFAAITADPTRGTLVKLRGEPFTGAGTGADPRIADQGELEN